MPFRFNQVAAAVLTLTLMLSLLQGLAQAGDPPVLNEKEILTQIIGNTATGKTNGVRWSEYYEPNGTIHGRWRNDPYQGKWSISGSEVCYDYAGSEDDGCWTMSLMGDEITYYKDGKPDGTAKLLKGNPKDL